MARFVYRPPSLRAWVQRLKRGRGPVIPELAIPVADFVIFGASEGEPPLIVTFINLTNQHGPPGYTRLPHGGRSTSWTWDFGDGSPLAFNENEIHSYTAVGVYDVTMTACNSAGCDTLVLTGAVRVAIIGGAVILRLDERERVSASVGSRAAVSARFRSSQRVSVAGLSSKPTAKIRRLRSDERVSAKLEASDG